MRDEPIEVLERVTGFWIKVTLGTCGTLGMAHIERTFGDIRDCGRNVADRCSLNQ